MKMWADFEVSTFCQTKQFQNAQIDSCDFGNKIIMSEIMNLKSSSPAFHKNNLYYLHSFSNQNVKTLHTFDYI